MKINRTILVLIISILLVSPFVTSCKKEDHTPVYSYYVSKQFAVEFTTAYLNSLIDIASGALPDIAGLKTQIKSDIKVYKIIYKTTINGNQIDASGLIIVPSTPGNYPVLSFQNGTNTVNSSSPSESPLDLNYQLVELISSMGYVVVFADYPGFGESAQIPHPYLIKEPTVRSLVDLLYSAKEMVSQEFPGITLNNDYYLLGYSQGGWATLALHKALEQDYGSDFNLKGSTCGAGPYNIELLFESMVNKPTYPMPYYLAYIVNAYSAYNQFTNPVGDIFNEPYASRLSTLFTGSLTSTQINSQLTTSISGLITPDFLSGFNTSAKFSSVITALNNNSVSAWHTNKSLLLIHGGSDTSVDPISTENMYSSMIQSGTSTDICKKVIVPGVDHGDGLLPCMIQGITFLNNLKNQN
jgi:pimeloyl-ACP methyl ester carboxylesterase